MFKILSSVLITSLKRIIFHFPVLVSMVKTPDQEDKGFSLGNLNRKKRSHETIFV